MFLKIYKSSAGSGKTFTLVKEYLMLSLPDPNRFKNITALTFTNASASEMKARIIRALMELAEGKNNALQKSLLTEGITPKDLSNAPLLLKKILFDYSNFNINTLDSFFHRIVRSFHKELYIAADFEINIDAEEAIDFAIDSFIQSSNERPEIHKILIAFIREKISNGQSWNIGSDLYRIAKEVLNNTSLPFGETDMPKILGFISELKKIMYDFEGKMDDTASGLITGIQELGLELEDFKYGKAGAFSFILKSLKANRDYVPNSRFLAGLKDDFEWYKKNDPNLRVIEQALDTFLRAGSLDLFEKYENGYADYATAREILKNIYTYSVYEEISNMFEVYRAEKNVLLVSDFTRILAEHIDKEDISYIYSKIGSRLDHFLIDEFQDTSSLQWAAMKPLIENAVSQGNMCLVVGDSKQAIYRWRGGTVELIERQVSEIDFPDFSGKFNLDRNFRSAGAIVSFNNDFFAKVSTLFSGESDTKLLLNQIFEEVAQQSRDDLGSKGYVEINFIPKPERSRESFAALAREKLLEQINDSRRDGFSYSDITVLVRDKKDAADTASLLQINNIPFLSFDSLQLQNDPSIRFLISLISWMNNRDDVLSKTEALFLYHHYIDDIGDSTTLNHIIEAGDFPPVFIEKIESLVALPLYDMTEELLRIFDMNVADAHLQRFQDAVLEFVLKEKSSVPAFLEWWEDGNFTIVQPENQDAIRIMTIHKAKGLEFQVVMIPFADWNFNSGKPNMIWVNTDKEPFNAFPLLPVNFGTGLIGSAFETDYEREETLTVIDNLNLLYVALTRAKTRLYINTQSTKNEPANGIKSTYQLINQVLSPPKGDVESVIRFGKSESAKNEGEPGLNEDKYVVLDSYIVNGTL